MWLSRKEVWWLGAEVGREVGESDEAGDDADAAVSGERRC